MHLEITKLLDESSNPLIKFKNPISSCQNFVSMDQNLLYFFSYHCSYNNNQNFHRLISQYTNHNDIHLTKKNLHSRYIKRRCYFFRNFKEINSFYSYVREFVTLLHYILKQMFEPTRFIVIQARQAEMRHIIEK